MKNWKSGLPWLLGLALLLNLWRQFSPAQFREAFAQAGWGFVPLVLLALIWLPWDSLTLAQLVGRPWSARLVLLEWGAESLSCLIPLAGWGGEPFRYRHLESPQRFKIVVTYRFLHAWGGLATALAGAGLCWLTSQPGLAWGLLTSLGVLVFLLGLAAMLRARARFWPELSSAPLARAILCKGLSRTLQVAEIAAVLAVLGYPVRPQSVLLLHSTLMAAASIFPFVPGGLGVQEKALMMASTHLGLSPEIGFQLGLLRRSRQMAWALLGMSAVVYLQGRPTSETL